MSCQGKIRFDNHLLVLVGSLESREKDSEGEMVPLLGSTERLLLALKEKAVYREFNSDSDLSLLETTTTDKDAIRTQMPMEEEMSLVADEKMPNAAVADRGLLHTEELVPETGPETEIVEEITNNTTVENPKGNLNILPVDLDKDVSKGKDGLEDGEEPSEENAETNVQVDEEKPVTLDDTGNGAKNGEEKPKRKKGNSKRTGETDETFTTPGWSIGLKRQSELPSMIRMALKDILHFRHKPKIPGQKKDRSVIRIRDQRRIDALQMQRRRLQQQKIRPSTSNSDKDGGSNHAGTNHKVLREKEVEADRNHVDKSKKVDGMSNLAGDFMEDQPEENASDDDDDDDPGHRSIDEAWIVLVRALNSLVLLLPLLIEILCHEERENKGISIAGVKIVERRKASCWIIGRQVFDFTTRKNLEDLYHYFCKVAINMGLPEIKGRSAKSWDMKFCGGLLDDRMKMLEIFYNNSPSKESADEYFPWTNRDPLSPLNLDDNRNLAKVQAWTSHLDKELSVYGTTEELKANEEQMHAVRALEERLTVLLTKRFPRDNVRLRVYGSCLSGLTVGRASDVDISLELKQSTNLLNEFESGKIDAATFDIRRKKLVYNVCRCLEDRREFSDMIPVAKARVPVVKGKWSYNNSRGDIKTVEFDICFFNSIAVANSSLLKEYTAVDARVAPLIRLVKWWAKDCRVASAADGSISSYAWTNLVLFYLQSVGIVPNLQSRTLMAQAGVEHDATSSDHTIKNLNTSFLRSEEAKLVWTPETKAAEMSVCGLFYGFIRFYIHDYPFTMLLVSLRLGPNSITPRSVFRRIKPLWTIEDPFETFDSHCPHDLNHADEQGQNRILRSFLDTESYLTHVFRSALNSDSEMPSKLWSSSNSRDEKNERSDQKDQVRPTTASRAFSSSSQQNGQSSSMENETEKKQRSGGNTDGHGTVKTSRNGKDQQNNRNVNRSKQQINRQQLGESIQVASRSGRSTNREARLEASKKKQTQRNANESKSQVKQVSSIKCDKVSAGDKPTVNDVRPAMTKLSIDETNETMAKLSFDETNNGQANESLQKVDIHVRKLSNGDRGAGRSGGHARGGYSGRGRSRVRGNHRGRGGRHSFRGDSAESRP